jgi:universal stress protein E
MTFHQLEGRAMTRSVLRELQRVIAVVDPELDTQPAIERMLILAKTMEFDIKLVACDYSQYLVEGYYFAEHELPALREEYLSDRKKLLETLAEPLREGGLKVQTEAIWSYPRYAAIVELAESYQPDLIIQHAHRHGPFSRLMLTNDDWQIMRHCPTPLLLVKDKPWKHSPVILAAVDPMHARAKPSGLDGKILAEGQLLAEKLDGSLYVVHAYGRRRLPGILPIDAEERHRAALNALAGEFDIPPSQRVLMKEAPEDALRMLEVELQADLVIIGSISRSLLKDVFIGSTTERVLDYLDCDALLMRPDN